MASMVTVSIFECDLVYDTYYYIVINAIIVPQLFRIELCCKVTIKISRACSSRAIKIRGLSCTSTMAPLNRYANRVRALLTSGTSFELFPLIGLAPGSRRWKLRDRKSRGGNVHRDIDVWQASTSHREVFAGLQRLTCDTAGAWKFEMQCCCHICGQLIAKLIQESPKYVGNFLKTP